MSIRRINLMGGPSLGKSVIASYLFAELKKLHVNIELINEWIKLMAYKKEIPTSFDQFYAIAKQIRKEDRLLRSGLDFIVSDSPVLLNAAYSKKYNCPFAQQCVDVSLHFDKSYPAVYILLDRTNLPYQEIGRYENYEEALQMDKFIKRLLEECNIEYQIFNSIDSLGILNYIKGEINVR